MAPFYIILLFITTSLCGPCDVEPFQVPIKDVNVVPRIAGATMRGIQAMVGSPPQQIAVLPWAELNNTWIYDSPGFCDKSVIFSDTICLVRRGNFFDEDSSTSWNASLDIVEAGGAPFEIQAPNVEKGVAKLVSSGLGGTDIFNLGNIPGNGSFNRYPIGIPRLAWDAGYSTMHSLGLGRNSTYINALYASGRVGSRVWAIFWGRMWLLNDSLDGSVVFGGYDRKKVTGKNHTQALDFSSAGCGTGMKVTVSDIKVNFRDGTDKSLFQPNTALQLCIMPQKQLLMEVPANVYGTFENITNTRSSGLSFGLHWSAQVFKLGTAFDGDITIQLSSGLEIRVPNNQYIVPPVFVERNGTRIINNDGTKEVLIGAIADQPATLGRYFLTAAYLMVNQDVNSFTIWQANPTTSSELVSVLDEKTAQGCANTTAIVQPPPVPSESAPTSSAPSSTPSPAASQAKGRLQIAAIAGVAIGGVVGLCIIAAVIFCLRRRSPLKNAPQSSFSVLHKDDSSTDDGKIHRTHQAMELQGSKGYFSELQGSGNNVYEMSVEPNTPRR